MGAKMTLMTLMTLMTSDFFNRKKFFVYAILILFIICNVSARGAVLFYETKSTYKIDSQYSKFKEALESKGYVVSKLEILLTKEVLKRNQPDVLVLAGLSSSLTPTEQAAIFEFVMQDGRGLFISGGTPAANQLSIPFGMTIDDAPLEDETDPIKDASTGEYLKDKSKFSLGMDNIVYDPVTRSITQGVSQLGFFGGNGISISGNAKAVVVGDWDTYAPKSSIGRFPKGSKPPIAVSAIVGKGLIFLLSDADMLANANLDTNKYRYDNLRFGTNIIDWLSIRIERPENVSLDELQVIIGGVKQENSRLNDSINKLKDEKETLIRENSQLKLSLEQANEKIEKMEAQRFMGIPYWMLAIGMLTITIIVVAVVMAKKMKKVHSGKISELGFEFGGEKPGEEKEEGEEEELGETEPLEIGGGKFEGGFLEGEEDEEEGEEKEKKSK